MDITISDAIDAAWNKDKDVIMKIISSKRLAIPYFFKFFYFFIKCKNKKNGEKNVKIHKRK